VIEEFDGDLGFLSETTHGNDSGTDSVVDYDDDDDATDEENDD